MRIFCGLQAKSRSKRLVFAQKLCELAIKQKQRRSLVGKVPGLLTVDFVEAPLASSTHDMALVTTLEKAEDVAVYAKHPEHVKVADTYVRPYTTERAALDYEE